MKELIEACGERFYSLEKRRFDWCARAAKWNALYTDRELWGWKVIGKTPEETLIKLLKLLNDQREVP